MKASIPSHDSEIPKINRNKRKLDFTLRTWQQVADMYNAKTGENMSADVAENTHYRALRKLRIALEKAENAGLRELFEAEMD